MANWKEKFRAIMAVYVILENKDGEVLLLLRENTGYCDGQYGLPAGHVDGNEELLSAMRREALEEVGVRIGPEHLELVHTMHRYCGDHERIDFFFKCTNWEGEPINAEPHKCGGIQWFDLRDLPEELIDYYRHMFECIERGENYSSFGWTVVH
ncbi:MAG: NUDIX domain-containing protein [Candidatus Uhrbacteria bacterium]|nr:NUDIX domain-containing protein [Candidatus Uhrbacteria bacterium]